MKQYDVVVVGASIAGSTVATLLGRTGARVALVERHLSVDAFKTLCTHHVMSCATPTIRRLGVDSRIEAAGGIRNGLDSYTPWGWVRPPKGVPHGYSIRREKLDPLLRRTAAETPGVDLLLGQRVVGLLGTDGGDRAAAVGGVRVQSTTGVETTLSARLVVGADGAHSTVARLVGTPRRVTANERFVFFAQFTDVELTSRGRSQIWLHEPDIAYALPNDDGVTVLACMPTKPQLPRFAADREGALLRTVRGLPDGPTIDHARRVSKVIGTTDYPLLVRPAVPADGVALVGDAALTSDPSQGVGCGWAFESAGWLADAVGPALRDGGRLGPALRRYRRRHRSLDGHQSTIAKEAKAGPPTALDRLVLKAAAADPVSAARLDAFANRTIAPREFLAPRAIMHDLLVVARASGRATAPPTARSAAPT